MKYLRIPLKVAGDSDVKTTSVSERRRPAGDGLTRGIYEG